MTEDTFNLFNAEELNAMKAVESKPETNIAEMAKKTKQKKSTTTTPKTTVVLNKDAFDAKLIDADTILYNVISQTRVKLGELFPNKFDENGKVIPLVSTDKEGEVVNTSLLDDEKDESKKAATAKKATELSSLTTEDMRLELCKSFPMFESRSLTYFTLDKETKTIYVMIAAGGKGSSEAPLFLPGGKIPEKLFLDFFKRAIKIYVADKTEVEWQIFWSIKNKKYFMYEPEQVRTLIYVKSTPNEELQKENIFIGSIHSHHVFKPTPSPVDDKAEVSNHLYLIFGDILGWEKIQKMDWFNIDHLTSRTYLQDVGFLNIKTTEVIDHD
ncbi:hypothetical protein [Latilactobacillus sakei]|uniref:hypothetical protein n=1 Tax=Latilactobacillus sakei TaxID=1599 RepID=UPI00202E0738|nr:hypothetical protein [Latilactobacillus sakei]MCM1635785.1 hypothetical protein [Latilactobacillus sakei]